MRTIRSLPLLLLSLTLLLASAFGAACCTDSSAPVVHAEPTPTADAPELPAGLRAILDRVSDVRGLPAPPTLDAQVVARNDLPKLLESLTTDDDRHWFATTTTLYRLLGHFRKDQDYLSIYNAFGATGILGLYSPLDQKLWVVTSDGGTADFNNLPRQETITLAHELTHALQDYNFHLQEQSKSVNDDLDRSLAYTSVVEGDAVTNEQAYSGKYLLLPSIGPNAGWRYLVGALPAASDIPPSIVRELYFPYQTGADWVKDLRDKSGTKAIDDLLAHPPSATALILHPELLTNGWKPADIRLPDIAPKLGEGWSRESGGTFGEFQVRNYLQLRIRASEASSAAAGWDGDHYDVYVHDDQSVAVFRLRFKDPAEAAQFVAAQDNLLQAAGKPVFSGDGLTVVESSAGPVTARAASNGADVVFAIGSNSEIARNAVRLVQ